METEKKSPKKIVVRVLIAVLAAAVLATAVLLVLNRKPDAQQTQGDPQPGTSVTEPAGDGTDTPEEETTEPAAGTHTVIFKDYNGTVLKTQQVEHGKAAEAPKVPTRKYYTFAGWDKAFDKVTEDMEVTATYTTDRTIIYAESVSVDKGAGQVTVNIRILNNPGILGAELKVSVDDKVFAYAQSTKTGYPYMKLTASGPAVDASPYTFMLDAMELSAADRQDGTLFAVTFDIKDAAAAGSFAVKLACDKGTVFTEDYADAKVVLEDGVITIG